MIDISKGRYWDEGIQLVSSCTPCSEGCRNCWALAMEQRFKPEFKGQVECHPEYLKRFNTRKPKVFSLWNDLFHENIPDSFVTTVLCAIASSEKNTFLILTKRPNRMADYFLRVQEASRIEYGGGECMMELDGQYAGSPSMDNRNDPICLSGDWPLKNLYTGLTVCNQQEADEKIPIFLQVPGKKFLSIEPMLGPPDLRNIISTCINKVDALTGTVWEYGRNVGFYPNTINAVILGGETLGNRAGREMKMEWVESIVDQCHSAGIPLFIKQIHLNGKVSKDMNEWPENLRRRKLPWIL
jgi:protein gp37